MGKPQIRPAVHFTAQSGWINDPHGISFINGRYHLFFQYVPGHTNWDLGCHWGHAVSDDLTTWEEQPIALAPGDGDDGIWTGSISVNDAGEAIAFYTAVSTPNLGIGRVRIARPLDAEWNCWEKGEVVQELPTDLDAIAFRDPFVFREGNQWRMLVGAALRNGTAAAASFSSPDRLTWSYDGLACERSNDLTDPVWTGALWECPQLFEIDGSHILLASVWEADVLHYVAYAIGTYENGKFIPQEWHRLTYGDSYYAPSFFRDRDGNPCLMFWLREAGGSEQGWAGAHSIAHQLTLENGRLCTRPHPETVSHISAPAESRGENKPAFLAWEPNKNDLKIANGTDETILRRTEAGIEIVSGNENQVIADVKLGSQIPVLVDGSTAEVFLGAACFAIASSSALTGTQTPISATQTGASSR